MRALTKRLVLVITSFTLCFMIAACGSAASSPDSSAAEGDKGSVIESKDTQTDTALVVSEADHSEQKSNGTNILVVYFSRTGEQYGVGVIDEGNTAIVAKMIAEETGADTFEVIPADDHYPMTYDALTEIAKKELNENALPGYRGGVPDLTKYDTVFIGAPVWWGDWPMIMYTFFEGNRDALAGKTLIPFSTHAGSGLSGFDSKLSGACPDSTVGTGLAISGTDAQNHQDSVRESVNSWLSGLGY